MTTDLWFAVYTLAGIGAGFLLLLVYNIAAAPYRNEKELRQRLELRNTELTAEVGLLTRRLPDLHIRIEQSAWGIENFIPDMHMWCFWITVKNRGETASIADDWIVMASDGKSQIRATVVRVQESIRFPMGFGTEVHGPENTIEVRMAKPLGQNSMEQGILLAVIPKEILAGPLDDWQIAISAKDINGREFSVSEAFPTRREGTPLG